MVKLKVGDIVARKSYGMDVFFKILNIVDKRCIMKGLNYRILADAPVDDLVLVPEVKLNEFENYERRMIEKKYKCLSASMNRKILKKGSIRNTPNDKREFKRPGNVLHLDGDEDYLNICLREYEKLDIEAVGQYVPESKQPSVIYNLLQEHKPDILVITGHDSVLKGKENYGDLNNYSNSKYFIESVKEARRYEPDMDSLVIFAGACQSYYHGIIKAGANFASAPFRVLIHTLDPVMVTQKIAYTESNKMVSPKGVIENTITGVEGIGGLETRGKYRSGYPMEPYA